MNKLIRRLAMAFVGISMAVGVGVAVGGAAEAREVDAADQIKYSLDPVAGSDNGYASSEDINVTDEAHSKTITWNVTGNSTLVPWRLGGKSLSSVNRAIYSKTALSEEVNAIEVTTGTSANCTINSLTVMVYSQASDAASGSENNKLASFSATDDIVSDTVRFEKNDSTSWNGAFYRIVYNITVSGKNNKFLEFVGADFIESVNDISLDSISSVSLSNNSVPVNYAGDQITATATFAPIDANEEIVWSSSNNSVATITATQVYGLANISIVGIGNCTFTATAKNHQTIYATSETFFVTEAVIKNVFDITFVGNGGSDSSTAFANGEALLSGMVNDGDSLSISNTLGYVYPAANKTIKFSSSKNNGYFSLDTGTPKIKKIVIEVKAYAGDSSSLTVTVGSTPKVIDVDSDDDALKMSEDFTYFALDYTTASNEVTFQATNRIYIRNIILIKSDSVNELKAYPYAADLMRITAAECKTASTPTTWGTLSSAWDTLGSDAQDLFNSKQAKENGNVIEQSLARYEVIVKKYHSQLGENANFMSRVISYNSANTFIGSKNNENTIGVIAIISLIVLAAAGGYFVIRKRKENN